MPTLRREVHSPGQERPLARLEIFPFSPRRVHQTSRQAIQWTPLRLRLRLRRHQRRRRQRRRRQPRAALRATRLDRATPMDRRMLGIRTAALPPVRQLARQQQPNSRKSCRRHLFTSSTSTSAESAQTTSTRELTIMAACLRIKVFSTSYRGPVRMKVSSCLQHQSFRRSLRMSPSFLALRHPLLTFAVGSISNIPTSPRL